MSKAAALVQSGRRAGKTVHARAMWRGDYGLYAILGYPLEHTLSPAMQNAAFKALGLRHFYISLPITPARFRRIVKRIRHTPLDGFNLTVPHKELVLPALSWLSPEARAIGAVNTVACKHAKGGKTVRLSGYNTDAYGFREALGKEGRFSPRGKTALVLGAGGAARACVYALLKAGAKRVYVSNRTRKRAEKLVRNFKRFGSRLQTISRTPAQVKHVLETCALLVNATSLGLRKGDPLPLPAASLPKRRILVADLIYNPSRTKLCREARRRGHRVMNGRSMLLYQGAKAFEIWTGRRAPVSVMKRVLGEAEKN